ncbi:DUF6301 family protein [Nocardia sp. XZ_19_369]|uniref:DUF6301 family protein n=1 Tax=Nocardia sp. XZ_19_369 TaxID=2769487 RepID=UPI00188EBA96|nr:DUF6301 family protein [Nocardia sp. XZ_19_369]
MRVDRAGALGIGTAATEFDWTWTLSDLDALIAMLGGREPAPPASGQGWLELRTGLDVEQPVARVFGIDGRIDSVAVAVAGIAAGHDGGSDRDSRPALAAAFDQLSIGLWALWREPTGIAVSTKVGVSWSFPNVVVGLAVGERTVDLWLVAPAEHERLAATARSRVDEFTASAAWVSYEAAIPVLVQAVPGAWSKTDLGSVFTQLGWSAREDEVRGTWTAQADPLSLRASRTSDHQRRFGYGDYDSLRLCSRLPMEVIDIAYGAALGACVRLLDTPSFVGGPEAVATWRRRDTTLTLSREVSHGRGSMVVELKPTAASENEDAYYSEWDQEWIPAEYWRIRPNPNSSSDLEGMWFPGTRAATDWETFDKNLYTLFISLGVDLPVLGEYVPSITWVIMAAGVDGYVAQGWFSPTQICLEIVEDIGVVCRAYPPGRDSAEQVAELTQAALHAAADSPQALRYYAFAPAQLWDFRLGIAESPDER